MGFIQNWTNTIFTQHSGTTGRGASVLKIFLLREEGDVDPPVPPVTSLSGMACGQTSLSHIHGPMRVSHQREDNAAQPSTQLLSDLRTRVGRERAPQSLSNTVAFHCYTFIRPSSTSFIKVTSSILIRFSNS
jgi:hypothetical protein